MKILLFIMFLISLVMSNPGDTLLYGGKYTYISASDSINPNGRYYTKSMYLLKNDTAVFFHLPDAKAAGAFEISIYLMPLGPTSVKLIPSAYPTWRIDGNTGKRVYTGIDSHYVAWYFNSNSPRYRKIIFKQYGLYKVYSHYPWYTYDWPPIADSIMVTVASSIPNTAAEPAPIVTKEKIFPEGTYNIKGQKVYGRLQNGIYIRQGKKFIVFN